MTHTQTHIKQNKQTSKQSIESHSHTTITSPYILRINKVTNSIKAASHHHRVEVETICEMSIKMK